MFHSRATLSKIGNWIKIRTVHILYNDVQTRVPARRMGIWFHAINIIIFNKIITHHQLLLRFSTT